MTSGVLGVMDKRRSLLSRGSASSGEIMDRKASTHVARDQAVLRALKKNKLGQETANVFGDC